MSPFYRSLFIDRGETPQGKLRAEAIKSSTAMATSSDAYSVNGSFQVSCGGHMLLGGRTAIVTGGGRGIGREIARKLASEGAAVLLASPSSTETDAVAAEIQQAVDAPELCPLTS
jgi:phosphoglycerate dehydrogenase-like enzyme